MNPGSRSVSQPVLARALARRHVHLPRPPKPAPAAAPSTDTHATTKTHLKPHEHSQHPPNTPPQVGDVIYIEANSGAVKRVGRCDAYATEYDLEAEEYVPLPKVGRRVCGCVGVCVCA